MRYRIISRICFLADYTKFIYINFFKTIYIYCNILLKVYNKQSINN